MIFLGKPNTKTNEIRNASQGREREVNVLPCQPVPYNLGTGPLPMGIIRSLSLES